MDYIAAYVTLVIYLMLRIICRAISKEKISYGDIIFGIIFSTLWGMFKHYVL